MNHSVENPVTHLNLTKSATAGRRALRSAMHLSDRKKVHIPGLESVERARSGPGSARVLSMEDLPIALRIAAVARQSGADSFEGHEPQCDVATSDKELIDGLVRVLSRGQGRRERS